MAFEYEGVRYLRDDDYQSSSLYAIKRAIGNKEQQDDGKDRAVWRYAVEEKARERLECEVGREGFGDVDARFGDGSACGGGCFACEWRRRDIVSLNERARVQMEEDRF